MQCIHQCIHDIRIEGNGHCTWKIFGGGGSYRLIKEFSLNFITLQSPTAHQHIPTHHHTNTRPAPLPTTGACPSFPWRPNNNYLAWDKPRLSVSRFPFLISTSINDLTDFPLSLSLSFFVFRSLSLYLSLSLSLCLPFRERDKSFAVNVATLPCTYSYLWRESFSKIQVFPLSRWQAWGFPGDVATLPHSLTYGGRRFQ